MGRPIVLIHGYSAEGLDFEPLCKKLTSDEKNQAIELNVGNYVSLNNEITIKDIAEGFDRALRQHPKLKSGEEFDAIVHSTGMLVLRSWLTNYGAAVGHNERLRRLKHLIGLAPATWGSPQAHKGRTWIGALVKGNREPGPDFLNAGDAVLDGLELGSRFTWDLAHLDLLGQSPYYDAGSDTPYVCIFIGNRSYSGIASVANDPGTDGTVRWAGCGLNTRKISIDLTRTPIGEDGKAVTRVSITPWAGRVDIPMIPVEGKNHATLISDPDDDMVQRIVDFLNVADQDSYKHWVDGAKGHGERALEQMRINPGKDAAGIGGDLKALFGHLIQVGDQPMEGWQQFVVHVRDERGDPVTDYLIDVLHKSEDGKDWVPFTEMYTDVHAYGADPSFRCFHIRLPEGFSKPGVPLQIRVSASTGTKLMAYQGYGSNDDQKTMSATTKPVLIEVNNLGDASLFYAFTTTLVEVIVNREPSPLDAVSDIFKFLERVGTKVAQVGGQSSGG